MRENPFTALLLIFVPFSLTAFGGGLSVIAGIQEQVVDVSGWMSAKEFLHYFAISRAAPGPGSMLSTLIGWHIAGIPGAFVATIAMFLPSSILCAVVAVVWRRYRGRRWLAVIEEAVTPLGVGMLVAGVLTLAPIAMPTISLIALGVASCGAFWLRPTLHPLVILCTGAATNLAIRTFFG